MDGFYALLYMAHRGFPTRDAQYKAVEQTQESF
jgi:hypothetical protein